MAAAASRPDNIESGCHSNASLVGQCVSAETGPPTASSAFSLSMMRRAFAGLLADPSAMSSMTEQRDELEFPVTSQDGLGRQPNSFVQEKYSFESVSESHGLRLDESPARSAGSSSKGSPISLDMGLGRENRALHFLDSLDARGLSG
jgi:hypothetical protein